MSAPAAAAGAPQPESLRALISRRFLSSSLIPLLTIEVVLLLLYFGINRYIAERNRETLLLEVNENIHHIVETEGRNIDTQLREISNDAMLLQSEHQRFFRHPELRPPAGLSAVPVRSEAGSWYKGNDNGGSSVFYARTIGAMDAAELDKFTRSEVMDPVFRHLVETNGNIVAVYFNSHDGMNRYYPPIPDVWKQYTPDLHMQDYNFYYEADATHNPSRRPVWTGAYLDPAGQGWMVSCIVPVYRGDFLEGVTGIDVTIRNFVDHILKLNLPWRANAFLVDREGSILAMPPQVGEVLGLSELTGHVYQNPVMGTVTKGEDFNLLKHKDAAVAAQFGRILRADEPVVPFSLEERRFLMLPQRIRETGWKLVVMVDEAVVFEPIHRLTTLSRNIGYAAIGVMLFFYIAFFAYLLAKSRAIALRISRPLSALADAAGELGSSRERLHLEPSGIEEVDSLQQRFDAMAGELRLRADRMIEAEVKAQVKDKEQEAAYNAGLFESASSYLHNIGNSLAGIDGKLLDLRAVTRSMQQYPAVFAALRDAHRRALAAPADADPLAPALDRFEEILVGKVVPSLEQTAQQIGEIRDQIVSAIRHQQEAFVVNRGGREKFVQDIEVDRLLAQVVEDFRPSFAAHGIAVETAIESPLPLRNQRHQLLHGLINLVKNAVEAVAAVHPPEGRRIRIEARPNPSADGRGGVRIVVADNGAGIEPDHAARIFSSGFTTKANGHGLGLHSFLHYLNENAGKIRAASAGRGQGATFVVEVADE